MQGTQKGNSQKWIRFQTFTLHKSSIEDWYLRSHTTSFLYHLSLPPSPSLSCCPPHKQKKMSHCCRQLHASVFFLHVTDTAVILVCTSASRSIYAPPSKHQYRTNALQKNFSLPEREGQHEYLKRKLLLDTRRQKKKGGLACLKFFTWWNWGKE